MNTLLFFEFSAPEIMMVLFVLAYPVLALFCLVDIARSNFKDQVAKLIWVIIALSVPFVGAFIYLTIGRKSKIITH